MNRFPGEVFVNSVQMKTNKELTIYDIATELTRSAPTLSSGWKDHPASKESMNRKIVAFSFALTMLLGACSNQKEAEQEDHAVDPGFEHAISKPLISHIYTADPSAHVFNEKIYLYPSHDEDVEVSENDNGDHFQMKDYHVFSLDSVGGEVKDHGSAFSVDDVPWAEKQLWAPDVAQKGGKYFFYFPAKDKEGIFRIGVAVGDQPEGPFMPEQHPIKGSYSIDPAVFTDEDGHSYLYFGGLWGGQLQKWKGGIYDPEGSETDWEKDGEPAIAPKVARLNNDMLQFDEEIKAIEILDQQGNPILAGDHDRRFFEGAWMHKYQNRYYFSYSTGDTHRLVYAIGDSPYGPFTYQGIILEPVVGWTTHHSIVNHDNRWWLFYHDTELSRGKTHLRNVKTTELTYDPNGKINTIFPYGTKK